MWGFVLVACFIAGALVTVVALRSRSRRRAAEFDRLLQAGTIVWGGQIRWKRGRAWGASGSLLLASDGLLTWAPDSPSSTRGSTPSAWPIDLVDITLQATRRDISGIQFNEYRIVAPDHISGRFGMFHEVGTRPTRATTR